MSPVLEISRATLLEARYFRVPELLLAALALSLLGAWFIDQMALIESAALRTSLVASALRVFAVLLTVLLVATGIVRDYEDELIAQLLALPVPRWIYLLGRAAGFMAIVAGIALACTLMLLLAGGGSGSWLWGASLALELTLVALATLLLALSFRQVAAAVITALAFYLLARALNTLISMLEQAMARGEESALQLFSQGILGLLAWLMPDLDRYTPSGWAVQAATSVELLVVPLQQTLIYAALLLAAALVDLYRQELT